MALIRIQFTGLASFLVINSPADKLDFINYKFHRQIIYIEYSNLGKITIFNAVWHIKHSTENKK